VLSRGDNIVKNTSSTRINIRYKLVALISGTALITALLLTLLVYPLSARLPDQSRNGWLVIGYSALSIVIVSIISYTLCRVLVFRLEQISNVTQAWLRGNLKVRIDDPTSDDLGDLADNLDQLVGHLEEDEEDLGRLSQSNTRLTDQVRALAVVEERNRLARELHDSVKQHLFSLVMTASAIKTRFASMGTIPDDVVEMADEIVKASQSAQRETTRLIEDLRPGSLEERGLAVALNDYTLLFGAQEHLLVYLDVQCNDQTLPPPVAEAFYRVAQESLHNVARHAHATRVDLDLRCDKNRAILKITDNGIGFDTTRARQGLGIGNMQERLLSVGGRLTIESQPSIGTTVEAEAHLIAQQEPETEEAKVVPGSANFNHWLWLGQRLVIPVGQTWPWLPDDEQRHLAEPIINPQISPLVIRKERRLLGIRACYSLRSSEHSEQHYPISKILREKSGYSWDLDGGNWDFQHIRGLYGRSILLRNGQVLAAMQYQGRQMNTWTEVVYQTQTYNLSYNHGNTDIYTLKDNQGNLYVEIDKSKMTVVIHNPIPLPLLLMTIGRFLDEALVMNSARGRR
jgi:signal transduction histidine kinase